MSTGNKNKVNNSPSKNQYHSYSKGYYYDKFNQKGIQLFNHLKNNPKDEEAQAKLQFINNFLKEGNEGKWATTWREWEESNFCWPIEQLEIKEKKEL